MKKILIMLLFMAAIVLSACAPTQETVPISNPAPIDTAPNTIIQPAKICTTDYVPVCGEDGHTYANACLAGNVKILKQGECPESHICTVAEKAETACTREYLPVCGSANDGTGDVTYDNRCVACASGKIRMWSAGMCD